MDITDILNSLGLDLSDPEVKRGAVEALDAILDSRAPANVSSGAGRGGDDTEEIELDPDLIQPSLKQQAPSDDLDDIEIEDEENILDQIQHNDSDVEPASTPSDNEEVEDTDDSFSSNGNSTDSTNVDSEEVEEGEAEEETEEEAEEETEEETDSKEPENSNKSETADEEDVEEIDDEEDTDGGDAGSSSDEDGSEDSEKAESGDENIENDELVDSEVADEDDEEIDEDDLLDDESKDLFTDIDIKSKHEARKIKRERTLSAAKKALIDAQAKRVSPALIQELEKAIAALEELTEAVKKSIKDLSDDEFNSIINRVFDAIDAVGDTSLTFTSEAERELQAQEIKNDLADSRTQAELSAEDVAKIRAENQAVKARDKEANKFKARSRASFKGFQDFLNSLYRAIALQVHTDEVQDDTWSALNRRHSGSGVLQPGKRIQELPNRKIPVIDFYFDCSGSWDESDIAVGQKAVSKLADMEADGQIKINIYYFSDDVYSDAETARAQGSTSGWNEIVKNVISTQATNVIVMTDSDMENWWNGDKALSYTVPGYVWYLWRDGENAPRLPRDLKGRGGTQQFSFSRNDL